MKIDEFKLRLNKAISDLIDVYFCDNNIVDRFTNSTLKALINANMEKVDNILGMFADKNGEIDAVSLINTYADGFGNDGIRFDIKDYIKNDFIRGLLPNKALIISKDDILKIAKKETEETMPSS